MDFLFKYLYEAESKRAKNLCGEKKNPRKKNLTGSAI